MLGGISGVSPYSTYYMNPYRGMNAASSGQIGTPQQTQNAQRTGTHTWSAHRPADPNTPVQPVQPVKQVNPDAEPAEIRLPAVREGADPAEMAVRMRITPYQDENALLAHEGENPAGMEDAENNAAVSGRPANSQKSIPGQEDEEDSALGVEDAQEAMEEGECQTCEKRKYQDGSDDMSVSFQSPTNIKPEQVASAVRGHEMEHVIHEQAKAKQEGRKVVSQSVTLHTAICPECGKVYISGGETRTTTKANPEQTDNQEEQEEQERVSFSVFG